MIYYSDYTDKPDIIQTHFLKISICNILSGILCLKNKKVNDMNKKLSIIIILVFNSFILFSDVREENIDIFILLDKSLSMENNIEEVKSYIDNFIIDNIVIPGDRLIILNFYGETEDFIDTIVSSDDEKLRIKDRLYSVRADGSFTDIGKALDHLNQVVGENSDRIRYMLLITDGKQEAYPGTKYYSIDGSFNHELLKHTKTIQKKGWKIEVLGIGKLNKAAEIAEKLSGTYVTVEKADQMDLAEKTSDFLTIITIEEEPEIKKFGRNKQSVISFNVFSKNAKNESKITIDSIKFVSENNTEYELLDSPFSLIAEPDIGKEIKIPVKINSSVGPGTYPGNLEFSYSSDKVLTPSLFDIEITIKKAFNPLIIYIPLILIVLGILYLIIMKAKQVVSGKDEDRGFDILIDNEKFSDIPFILKNNEKLFLIMDSTGKFIFSRIRSGMAKAFLVKSGGKIDLTIIDSKLFPDFSDKIDNIIGKSVNIRLKSGKLLKLLFKRK